MNLKRSIRETCKGGYFLLATGLRRHHQDQKDPISDSFRP